MPGTADDKITNTDTEGKTFTATLKAKLLKYLDAYIHSDLNFIYTQQWNKATGSLYADEKSSQASLKKKLLAFKAIVRSFANEVNM